MPYKGVFSKQSHSFAHSPLIRYYQVFIEWCKSKTLESKPINLLSSHNTDLLMSGTCWRLFRFWMKTVLGKIPFGRPKYCLITTYTDYTLCLMNKEFNLIQCSYFLSRSYGHWLPQIVQTDLWRYEMCPLHLCLCTKKLGEYADTTLTVQTWSNLTCFRDMN